MKKVPNMQAMVLTVVGKDKPGLIEQIAKAVKQADGNWLKSSFCHLSGHFAGFVEVMLPLANHNQLIQACHTLSSLQITLVPAAIDDINNTREFALIVTGNDRQGIVNDISHCLANLQVSIKELNTHCQSAPNWGSPLFTAKMQLACAPDLQLDDIQDALEQITDDLVVELIKDED
ncbi:ACT domain-containing protein [Glaciecola sp. XM2]|uniref:glycine cleavage system protein R n=1 Tax=Glaciecola sp. XM2 TaxID=1914931 RepID=UPI002032B41B|nr:ACT domain-containing protein [Glaciecola sp. XM2]